MGRRLGTPHTRGHYSKLERELIDKDGLPLEPPRPSDIEGRPPVGPHGDDPLLNALIKEHPEKDPANIKKEDDDPDANTGP